MTSAPAANSTTGTRTVNIGNTTGASWITGTLDGVLHWNHTVYTTTPLTIVGSGQYRVIQSGTIVVEHNIAQFTTTTTFNGPLTHMAGCPFPVSGSVTTVLSSGGTETVTFTSTCGVAALVNPDGSRRTLYLSIVL